MEHKRYNTAGRARLLQYLQNNTVEGPQNAEEIYRGLCAAGKGPGRSSVYRLLSAMTEEGEVKRHRAPAPETGFLYQYVGTHHCDTHFHLHCLQCGGITHLECGCGTEIAAHLMEKHGFVTDCGRSVFYGICAACAAKGGKTV